MPMPDWRDQRSPRVAAVTDCPGSSYCGVKGKHVRDAVGWNQASASLAAVLCLQRWKPAPGTTLDTFLVFS